MTKIWVVNNRGEREPFSWKKIYLSAKRVGAPPFLAKNIADRIQKEAYEGITTKEIFRKIKQILLREEKPAGIRFNLKEAMRKLGPTGFVFEQYIGAIFSYLGYKVQTNQMIPGLCALYEIDFLAKKNEEILIGECKFHRLAGAPVDLKVALEVYARFLDINNGPFFKKNGLKQFNLKPLIVTNAKFTSQIIKYSQCVGIELLGWKYPPEKSLEFLIETNYLYPITILPSLTNDILEKLAQEKIILVRDLQEKDFSFFQDTLKIPEKRIQKIKEEANFLIP